MDEIQNVAKVFHYLRELDSMLGTGLETPLKHRTLTETQLSRLPEFANCVFFSDMLRFFSEVILTSSSPHPHLT